MKGGMVLKIHRLQVKEKDIEIQVDSGSGYGELCGKWVPIIIRNLKNIYIYNIQAKHAYW